MTVIITIILILLLLAAVLLVGLAATFGVVGIGWVVSRVFADLSLFEASLIAAIASAFALFVGYRILAAPISLSSLDEDEWEDEDEEEEDLPPIVPWRRSKFTDEAASAGRSSKRKGRR